MYKIVFYAPTDNLEQIKEAMFAAGAGNIGNYSHCCWQVLGTGQFKPLANSNPAIGSVNQLEQVQEYKVEMVCADKLIKTVIDVLLATHPYEQPAYQVLKMEDF